MTFYPALAVRTDFSLGESVIGASDLVKVAELSDTNVVGITDTMNVSALIPATKALAKSGKRAISGVRICVTDNAAKEDEEAYLTLYPTSECGMQAIYRLISRGNNSDRFYYHARVTWDDIVAVGDTDHLIMVTGDAQSVIQRVGVVDRLNDLLTRCRFSMSFISLVPHSTPYWSKHNKQALDIYDALFALGHDVQPLVVTPTLTLPENEETLTFTASIAQRRHYRNYLKPTHSFSPVSTRDIAKQSVDAVTAMKCRYGLDAGPMFAKGLRNTAMLVDAVGYTWVKQEPSLPILAADPNAAMIELCMAGWKERFSSPVLAHQPTPDELREVYKPRLVYELGVLKTLGFSSYFLLVADLVKWSKSQGILVGPGRGSVGGSLVAYLMGITDVDPIRFKLLFERFINPDRLDLPDADLDFMSTRREEVIQYLADKYGIDRVAGIANYNSLGGKSAIKDVGKVLGIDSFVLDAIKFLPSLHGQPVSLDEGADEVPQIGALRKNYPELWVAANKLEGTIKSFGSHAAGVVVAAEPLTNRAAIETRTGQQVINWDKYVSEDQGLVKLDVLGLSTLDTFALCLKLIKERHGIDLDLLKIPLDDEPTLKMFSEAKSLGIFQFEGGSVRRLLKDMASGGLLTFEDLVAINALNRPGPLDAGLVKMYVDRRNGHELVSYLHPTMEAALSPTYGVLAYQEQVMQVSRDLSGFTPGESDGLRKAIGKKDAKLMASFKQQFVDGAVNLSGMPAATAEALWSDIEGFAAYSFNRSHAVEYTLISYQAAYLKTHYLVEFYTAALTLQSDAEKRSSLVRDAGKDNIRILPPDINVATDRFEILNETNLMAPLSSVQKVSENAARAVMKARVTSTTVEKTSGRGKNKETITTTYGPGRFLSMEDVRIRIPPKSLNSGAMENLNKVGAFNRIEPGQPTILDASRKRDQIELMPGLMDQSIIATRDMRYDSKAKSEIDQNVELYRDEIGIPEGCRPTIGEHPKMMIIMEYPSSGEEGDCGVGNGGWGAFHNYVLPSLQRNGLSHRDVVVTSLARKPKSKDEKAMSAQDAAEWSPYLMREIEILKPPVILTLGSMAAKVLLKDIKGGITEHLGKPFFRADLDATIIVGFNPNVMYHHPSKSDEMDVLVAQAEEILSR